MEKIQPKSWKKIKKLSKSVLGYYMTKKKKKKKKKKLAWNKKPLVLG